jgi:ATP-dependent Clp protease, protease subunit
MKDLININWGISLDAEFAKEANVRSNNNEIYFTGGVSQSSIILLIKEFDTVLGNINKAQTTLLQSTQPIVEVILYIDSGGGVIKDCFKFIDYIDILKKNHGLHLTTVCNGLVASAATLMALTGDKRYITNHSTYMIHELFGHTVGTFTHLNSHIKHINIIHEHIMRLYLKYVPSLERDKLAQLLQNETWFSAKECAAMGFAEVIN